MKTVSGQVVSTKPVSLSQAARTISAFVAADNSGASQAVEAYLRRTSAAFNELVQFHKASNLKKIKTEDRVKIGEKGDLGNEEKVEGKKEKRKKNSEGVERGSFGVEKKIEDSLGSEKKDEEVNMKDGGRRKKERMKKAEDVEREFESNVGIKEVGKKKKKRKSEAVDEGENGNSTEQIGSKKKKRRRVEGTVILSSRSESSSSRIDCIFRIIDGFGEDLLVICESGQIWAGEDEEWRRRSFRGIDAGGDEMVSRLFIFSL